MHRPKKLPKRKTKIVATLGPASNSREVIRALIQTGMNVARLNFSHGTHEEHSRVLALVREESEDLGIHVAVFQDLCGPKIRIGPLDGDEIDLGDGASISLRYQPKDSEILKGSTKELFVDAFDPVTVLRPGEKALLADGRIVLVVKEIGSDSVQCKVQAGGRLRSRSGISLPDSNLQLDCLTEKDKADLKWAVANELDFIALSFVGSPDDLRTTRKELEAVGGAHIPLIAKIERSSSLDHLPGLIDSADVVMVARGDLGLELPPARVPGAQRLIIATANQAGTPVITATQMLMSMVNEVRPTRAEVSDVCGAVRDGTDAVMLSEETAIGKHPVVALRVLCDILQEAEQELTYERRRLPPKRSDEAKVADAVCFAACNAAEKISAAAVIACSLSGYTARLMAKYRPVPPLFGATPDKQALAKMCLYWGIEPLLVKVSDQHDLSDEVLVSLETIRDRYGLKPGSWAVISAGMRAGKKGTTNVMVIREIPRD